MRFRDLPTNVSQKPLLPTEEKAVPNISSGTKSDDQTGPQGPEKPQDNPTRRVTGDVKARVDERRHEKRKGRGRRGRRKRPRQNASFRIGEPRVVDVVVWLLSSKLYKVYGSIAKAANAFKSHRIAIDTCSGYNLVRRDCLPPDWHSYEIPGAPLPRLAGADSNSFELTAVVRLVVRLGNVTYRLPFVLAETLAVDVLLGTSFIDLHVASIDVVNQLLELRCGGAIAIVGAKGVEGVPGTERVSPKKPSRRNRSDNGHGTEAEPIRLARWVTIPATSQLAIRVMTKGSGLVFIELKPSLQSRHGVRLTNGVVDVMPNRTFDVIVANLSPKPRRLPKNTVLGYAKCSPLTILTPERGVAEEIGRVLNDSSPSDTSPTQGGAKDEGADEPSKRITRDEEPPNREEGESRFDLSRVKDGSLKSEIMEILRKHSAMWNGSLGTVNATEHRIDLVAGTKPIRSMPYRQGPAMRTKVAAEVTKMLNAGVIEPATSEWASPVVLVPKKDGTMRFCVDYRRLNTKTLADAYPLHRMDDCIDSLGNARVFSTLDCNSG